MRRQRATLADQLSQVIGVIELGRRTGLLSVERDGAAGFEEGDIYFLSGQAIYASTGTQSGRAALETLKTWGACRFAFLSDIPKPVPNIGGELRNSRSLQPGPLRSGGTGPRSGTGVFPRIGGTNPSASQFSRSGPLSGSMNRPGWSSPMPPSASPLLPFAPFDGQRQPGGRPFPYTLPRVPQPPEGVPPFLPPVESPPSASVLVLTPYQRPRRSPNPQDVPRLAAAYNLSRAHRTLLLLADGEHTVAELARLAGRSDEEALALFSDLIRLGLITLIA